MRRYSKARLLAVGTSVVLVHGVLLGLLNWQPAKPPPAKPLRIELIPPAPNLPRQTAPAPAKPVVAPDQAQRKATLAPHQDRSRTRSHPAVPPQAAQTNASPSPALTNPTPLTNGQRHAPATNAAAAALPSTATATATATAGAAEAGVGAGSGAHSSSANPPPGKAAGCDTDPEPVFSPKPDMPPQSVRLGETGTALIKVFVNVDGSAADASVLQDSGYHRLNEAARKAVLGWRFTPGQRNCVAQRMWVSVPIVFTIEQARP